MSLNRLGMSNSPYVPGWIQPGAWRSSVSSSGSDPGHTAATLAPTAYPTGASCWQPWRLGLGSGDGKSGQSVT